MLTNYMKMYPLTLLIVCAVVALSLLPFGRIEVAAQVPLADKWTHMVMYAAVSFVAGWEHHRRRRLRNSGRDPAGSLQQEQKTLVTNTI